MALLSAAALTACASSAAFAEGFGVYEWSAAGTAMGEAYMFGEEDPSVLAYNPAQITKLDGTYFSIGASLVNPDTKVLFRQLGPLVGGHGQNEVWENEYDPAVIPYMYYATKAGKNSWWGIAMFSRFGNQIEYDDLWPGRYDTIFSGIKGFTVQPTYAFKIGDKLSAAVGLDINYVKLRMRKSLPGAALAPGMGIGDIGTDLEGDTVNVGWLASLMYDFNEKTSLAVTYRSRIKHTMDDADIAFGMGGMDSSGGTLYHFCSSRSARVQRSDGRQIPSAYLGYCGGSGHNAVCRHGAEIPYCRSRGGRQVFKDCRRIFCHAVSYRTIPEYPVRRIFPELYRACLRDKEG